jgi:hypothetical protein
MTALTTYPAYIARDTHEGRWTINSRTRRIGRFAARELAKLADANGFVVLWECFSTAGGVKHFGRTRFLVQADGSLVGYTSEGTPIIVHPADRVISVMVD